MTSGARLLATQPMITGSNPVNGATDVPRYTPITFQVQLADSGSGIDPNHVVKGRESAGGGSGH